MTPESNNSAEIVKVFSGTMLEVELRQQALSEAEIESRVVGLDLAASVGSALGGSVELWVNFNDAEKAIAAIQNFDAKKGN